MYTLKSLLHNNGDSESACLAIGVSMDHGMLSYMCLGNIPTKAVERHALALNKGCTK